MPTKSSDRQIIAAALNARTLDDAIGVSKLIEASVGGRHTRPVGDRINNFGLMASSGSYEYKALEPVTNEQDAVLERLAVSKWGSMDLVPYLTPREAAEDLLAGSYRDQGDAVTVAFRESDAPTRSSKRLTIVYRDSGCGLEPSDIPNTIFALGSSHKTSSSWHQGAFGIGGASTYRNAKAVVLVTRRAPEMKPTEDRISVAVVLWEASGKAQSAYYLVTTEWPQDSAAEPWSAPSSSFPEFDPGTHMALISYGVEGFHVARSGDERSFDMVLNTRLFDPITPVLFTNEITREKKEYLRGLGRRFADNPRTDRLSDDEVVLYSFEGMTYRLPVTYYVFPSGDTGARRRFVSKAHALVFTSNGQVHHHWTPLEFRSRTKFNKIYERVFVVVETDSLPIELRTGLFTPDRSQLLANEAALQLEDQVADFISGWPALSEIDHQLVREAISSASKGKSGLQVGRRIASALQVKGFALTGSGDAGGESGGVHGTPRPRKKIETYPDPTTLEGPDLLVLEDGKTRYVQYMLNAVDDFFVSGRGELTFDTNHPDIDPSKHIAVSKLRDGYVRVQLQVPEGAIEGDFKLVAHLVDWHRAAGGIGASLSYSSGLKIVDEIPPRATIGGAGGTGKKGAEDGVQVAVLWSTAEKHGEGWNNSTPGGVEDVSAIDLAVDPQYAELAKLGSQKIPTITLNENYSPYKAYISARAKALTSNGAREAGDRYAVGLGLGLLVLQDADAKRASNGMVAADVEYQKVAAQAVARAVLLMMPEFDSLAREAGIEG
jgi:hypothetical protein